MRRPLALLVGGAVAAAAVVGIGLASRLDGPAGKPRTTGRVSGVVILSIDTLRADALEPDETGAPPMPSLVAFAGEGARFSGALAPSSWTAPSLATVMTGVVPLRHGLIDPTENNHLSPAVATAATLLKGAGWSTWASTGGGWAGAASGLEAGFDRFAEDFDDAPPAAAIERWNAKRPKDRPYFLWLHTYVAHDPYGGKDALHAPTCADEVVEGRRLGEQIGSGDPETVKRVQRDVVLARLASPCRKQGLESAQMPGGYLAIYQMLARWVNGGWRDDPQDVAAVERLSGLYRAALRSIVDRRVRATLDALAAAVPISDAAVFVIADHGEAFGEHGVLSHGTRVTDEMIRVPMLLRAPGVARGTAVSASCGLVDVMPTVLELAGLPPARDLDGKSLLALLVAGAPGRPIGSAIVATAPWSEAVGEPRSFRVAVRDGKAAWLGRYDLAKSSWVEDALFDRESDPHEQTALAVPSITRMSRSSVAGAEFADAVRSMRAQVERRAGR